MAFRRTLWNSLSLTKETIGYESDLMNIQVCELVCKRRMMNSFTEFSSTSNKYQSQKAAAYYTHVLLLHTSRA